MKQITTDTEQSMTMKATKKKRHFFSLDVVRNIAFLVVRGGGIMSMTTENKKRLFFSLEVVTDMPYSFLEGR